MVWKATTKLKCESTNGCKIVCTYLSNFTEDLSQKNLALSVSLPVCYSDLGIH